MANEFMNPTNVLPAVIPGEEIKSWGTLGSFEKYIELQYRQTVRLEEAYQEAKKHDDKLSAEYKAAMTPLMVITCWGEAQTPANVAQLLLKTTRLSIHGYLASHINDEVRHVQIEFRRIKDLGLADRLEVPREQTDLFRFVNSLPSFLEVAYGQIVAMEGYSGHILFSSIQRIAERYGDVATAITYQHVNGDETRHIMAGVNLVKEALAEDPDDGTWRILELEQKLLPILIRKLGRDSLIARTLYNGGLIEDPKKFEYEGFEHYKHLRELVGLPELKYQLDA